MSGRRGYATALILALTPTVFVLTVLGSVAINVATSVKTPWPAGLEEIRENPFRWTAVLTVGTALLSVLLWWLQERRGQTVPGPSPSSVFETEAWVVDRPHEVDRVIRGLRRRDGGSVGITTALHGAGGFGKTMLVDLVCRDRRTREWFSDRIYRVTLGRDVRSRADIAKKVNEVMRFITEKETGFEDLDLAGQNLGRLLDERARMLLVIDDVWHSDQLAPFLIGGRKCVRLVTTRLPEILPAGAVPVQVDQMSPAQSERLLSWELPPIQQGVLEDLMAATGRWPLLLRLVNRVLFNAGHTSAEVSEAAARVLASLRTNGPAAVDEMSTPAPVLDLDDPRQRARAVRATIEASTQLLTGTSEDRLLELGIFSEDETIPVHLLSRLWLATAGLDTSETRRLCQHLAGLSLISLRQENGGAVSIHDVVRDFLRGELGTDRITACNAVLVDTAASDLPAAAPLAVGLPHPVVAWWELADHDRYLWDHLISHLLAAGRVGQAEATACDLRWVEARLRSFGPHAPYTDLAAVPTARAEALCPALARGAHLLVPTDPEHAIVDALHSRVGHEPEWRAQVLARQNTLRFPGLMAAWPMPDQPDPTLRRTLAGHTDSVSSVAISPDGKWITTGGKDRTARSWDAVTGQPRTVLRHSGPVSSVAISPNGRWIATTSHTTVRMWDAVTGLAEAGLRHRRRVSSVAIAPDGKWIATASHRTARLWDALTGRPRTVLRRPRSIFRRPRTLLRRHIRLIRSVAISPDGTWLATASDAYEVRTRSRDEDGRRRTVTISDHTVRIWNTSTGEQVGVLDHYATTTSVAISPDGTWIATVSGDGTVGLWDTDTRELRHTLAGHSGRVLALALSRDGTWLATAGEDRIVRLSSAATGHLRSTLTGHSSPVHSLAVSPDGTWLATACDDHLVRLWDTMTAPSSTRQARHTNGVRSVAISPDGTWIATAGDDQTVRRWNTTTGHCTFSLTIQGVRSVAVSPDGSWIATAGQDDTVWLWAATTGQPRRLLADPDACCVRGLAISPDGSWLAVANDDETIRLWDTTTGEPRGILSGHTASVSSVAVSPDGGWIASTSDDKTVRLWNTATQELRDTLTHPHAVHAVAVSPDGSWIASAGEGLTVWLWDTTTGEPRGILSGHTASVSSVAISPDGGWIASTSDDKTIRLWNTTTNCCEASIRTDGALSSCAWAPDGRQLATVGEKGLYLFNFRSTVTHLTGST